MYITCKQKRCNSVNVCTDTSISYAWPVVCLFVGVCIFHMGERAPQDRVWPALLTSDIQGEEASVWAVRQGAGRRGEAGKTSETPRKEGLIPSTSWGGQAPWKVSTCKIKEDVVWSQEMGDYLVSTKNESLISCTFHCPLSVFLPHLFFFSTVINVNEINKD